ncbi:MAG: hypothetical protein U0271_18110 [Polyangiaceae bacterium]
MERDKRMMKRFLARATRALVLASTVAWFGCDERAPIDFGATPTGPGAHVRFDLAHTPLPDIPLPNDTATWPDPTSRTGLRINASLLAPTEIERDARDRFDRLEGWGTFSPITVSFDLDRVGDHARRPSEAAIDLANVAARQKGDDYDFEDDAVYVVNLETGVPVPLDLGDGNFQYTLKRLDRYWANDTRATERNLAFETIDESAHGAIDRESFTPDLDTDFDGVLDLPNLDNPFACSDPSPTCDNPTDPTFGSADCLDARRKRDRCMADHLLTWYERETDTLILRPVLPLDEATKYAVVVTDRLLDANGDPVKSPFPNIYHASQRAVAERVANVLDDPTHAAYFGDISGTALAHVAFTWAFTTQPTVSDLKALRDGLYGQGPFGRFATDYPPVIEPLRLVGATAELENGATDPPGWESQASCLDKVDDLYVLHVDEIRDTLELAVSQLFGSGDGPDTQLLLRQLDSIDTLVIGTFKSPYLLDGGPDNTDSKAAFDLDFATGVGSVTPDVVPFFLVVPKETAEFKQPFNVNIYGHGYTGNFLELIFYAGNLAQHGLATIGINAMGHGLDIGDVGTETLAKGIFSGACAGPLFNALTRTRARDLDRDGEPDSGGDFWSSYLFHTRDAVRQSVLDHIQLVRALRTFGTADGRMICKNANTGWTTDASEDCDTDGDGTPEVAGDFDGNGVADVGGPDAKYSTWGESLGGILSGVHGAIDAYVTSASPGSGGGGLTDIGVRSFQGGVIEAVLLRMWGPLVVSVPAEERPACTGGEGDPGDCTVCSTGQLSIRWVMPDVNDTGEMEITCVEASDIRNTTVSVYNAENDELRCARVGESLRFRVGIPTSIGDPVQLRFFDGVDQVEDYGSCRPTFASGTTPRTTILTYGKGHFLRGATNAVDSDACDADTCQGFQGLFYEEGSTLIAPAEGYGQIRQTPSLRRFLQLAQMALDPADPISFAPYYAVKQMTDPFGEPIAPHGVLTVNTIGDMNVPLNSGIAFARASGALPFLRPDEAAKYPEYANYVTPQALFDALGGRTPNRELVDKHVIEGITALARHPAAAACVTSANAAIDGTYLSTTGEELACFPSGCAADHSICTMGYCDDALDRCVPSQLGQEKCDEALYDADDLDEGQALYFEQAAPVPLRLARYTANATSSSVDAVWAPRLGGVPFGPDGGWVDDPTRRLTGLLDAYIVPEGVHTFVNGNPCEAFDAGTYLTNLVARFFASDGTDVYYLSHPATHHCLETSSCPK